jgi:hypothetical protein
MTNRKKYLFVAAFSRNFAWYDKEIHSRLEGQRKYLLE